MIIRKPFAFLVHRFKLLHILVLIPMIYMAVMYYRLFSFFNTFVSDGYVTTLDQLSSRYFSILMIISTFVILVFNYAISYLLKKKKYPCDLYNYLTIFYGIVFIYNFLLPGYLSSAELATLTSSSSLIVRGVINILFFLQPVAIIMTILLMFGFNIKTGEFLKIKDEINLDEEDNEEIEINVKSNNYKYKRFLNRYSKELKFYIIENKNIFKAILVVIVLIIAFFTIRYFVTKNKNIKVNQSFNYSHLSISFDSSVLSTLDYNGNNIKSGKIYLAVKLKVTNKTNGMHTIETGDFCLEMGTDECIYPILDKSGLFLDLAKPYYADQIGANTSNEYVIVYELDEKDARSNYKIKILDSVTYKEDDLIAKYKEINLKPTFSNKAKDVSINKLGDTIDLKGTTMLNSTIKIDKYDIGLYYRYQYNYCVKEECTLSTNSIPADYSKMLLILDSEVNLDQESSYIKNLTGSNDFFNDFVDVEYYISDKKYNVPVKNVTPKEVSNQTVLEVNSNIQYADKINLVFTIRDKKYTLKLKETD